MKGRGGASVLSCACHCEDWRLLGVRCGVLFAAPLALVFPFLPRDMALWAVYAPHGGLGGSVTVMCGAAKSPRNFGDDACLCLDDWWGELG